MEVELEREERAVLVVDVDSEREFVVEEGLEIEMEDERAVLVVDEASEIESAVEEKVEMELVLDERAELVVDVIREFVVEEGVEVEMVREDRAELVVDVASDWDFVIEERVEEEGGE